MLGFQTAEGGAPALAHHVDSPPGPPQYQEREAERIRLLTECGYELQRDGLRWLYAASGTAEREMEYQPGWWELAYAGDGALAGVIMAARNPTSAVVAYVGVVPAKRGRGLAAQLVRRGTAQLVASGASQIRGDWPKM